MSSPISIRRRYRKQAAVDCAHRKPLHKRDGVLTVREKRPRRFLLTRRRTATGALWAHSSRSDV